MIARADRVPVRFVWRVIWGELWHRRARTAALSAGILVATAAFAVFSGTSDSKTLQVRGTVGRNFRSSYDILVRPKGTETAIERSQGLVRDNYLSGIFGGITMAQYHRIARIRGVEVAAPIAMIGYVLQPVQFHIDLSPYLSDAPRQLFSVQVSRSTDRGLVRLTDQKGFMYVTSATLRPPLEISGTSPYVGAEETLGSGRTRVVCPTTSSGFASPNPFRNAERDIAACWSRRTGLQGFGWKNSGFKSGHFGVTVDWSFPFLLAAIDPQAEARLDGVNKTVVSGRYLRAGDMPKVQVDGDAGPKTDVPVLVSTHPYIDDQDLVTVRRLSPTAPQQLLHATLAKVAAGQVPDNVTGTTVLRRSYSTADAYRNLLSTISHQQTAVIENYWTSGPARYRQLGPRKLAPLPADHPLSVWSSTYQFTGAVDAPIDSKLTGYRPLRAHVGVGSGVLTVHLPTLKAVGQFDPTKLPGFSPLSRLPQETYNPPVAAPANARTRRLLYGHDLLPDSNLAGYLQAPPLLLTDLNSLSAPGTAARGPTAQPPRSSSRQ
jgi:putative ABC transport system permease protein